MCNWCFTCIPGPFTSAVGHFAIPYFVFGISSVLGNKSRMSKPLFYSAQQKPTFIYRTRDPESCVVRAQLYLAREPIRPAGDGEPLFHLEDVVYTERDDCSPPGATSSSMAGASAVASEPLCALQGGRLAGWWARARCPDPVAFIFRSSQRRPTGDSSCGSSTNSLSC
jgi:hypothetical protein